MELKIEKFDPTVAELQAIVSETSNITATDLHDKKQLAVVKATRIKLRDARIKITKTGKELREEANAFNKAVLAKEKELLAIVEPEESRLKSIEEEAERIVIMEARTQQLPIRRDALSTIGDGVEISDEAILEMDDNAFVAYRNERVSAKLEADRLALEAEQARLAREAEIEEAKKKAVQEAEERAKREADERVRLAEQAQKDAERREQEIKDNAEQEKKDAQEREKQAKIDEAKRKEKLEADKRYQAWLVEIEYSPDQFILSESVMGHVVAYKLVATYKK